MEREHRGNQSAAVEETAPSQQAEQTDAGTVFSSKGPKPEVNTASAEPKPTASQLAYDQKPTPGLATVKKLYADQNPTPLMVAQVIARFPDEREQILEWMRHALSPDAAHAVLSVLEDVRRKAEAPHREGGNLVINPLLPKVGVTWSGSTDDRHDDMNKRDAAEEKERDERAVQSHSDKPYDPIGDKLRGPEAKSPEQQANEAKLDKALKQAPVPDGGSPLELRKRVGE